MAADAGGTQRGPAGGIESLGGEAGRGVLTSFAPALRAPVGPLHWASTEHATVMTGCIDGAIRSGEAAAQAVLEA